MSVKGHFYECLKPLNSFVSKPTKMEVCLIALDEPLENRSFIPVGNLSDSDSA
jgi:hypothetical protein